MSDIAAKNKLLSTIRVTLLLMAVAFLLCLNGCSSKSTVIYIPQEKACDPIPQIDLHEDIAEALREYFTSWQGTRYRYGGLSHKGVDCSGFVLRTYQDLFGLDLPRTVREQVTKGVKVSKSCLQAGDLVFFKTGRFQKHVGIYLENGYFIHASQSKGVIVSHLNNVYWQKKFWQAHRLQPEKGLEKLSQQVAQQTVSTDA